MDFALKYISSRSIKNFLCVDTEFCIWKHPLTSWSSFFNCSIVMLFILKIYLCQRMECSLVLLIILIGTVWTCDYHSCSIYHFFRENAFLFTSVIQEAIFKEVMLIIVFFQEFQKICCRLIVWDYVLCQTCLLCQTILR